nr:hypothetical protein [Ligilactobacillus salivarius]
MNTFDEIFINQTIQLESQMKVPINASFSLIFGREASGFNHWRNSPRLVKVDSRRLLS